VGSTFVLWLPTTATSRPLEDPPIVSPVGEGSDASRVMQ